MPEPDSQTIMIKVLFVLVKRQRFPLKLGGKLFIAALSFLADWHPRHHH